MALNRKNVLKKCIKWLSIAVIIVILIALSVFTSVDRTPYKQMPYYASMMHQLSAFEVDALSKKGDTLRAAWHKIALTPAQLPFPLAGYGIRKEAISVRDTTFVRTFVFDNGKTRIAYVCLDLLIFPPDLKVVLRHQLETKYGLHLYLTATHTHSAPGGWEPKIAGRFLAGSYKSEYMQLLTNAIEQSIAIGIQSLDKVQYAYIRVDAPEAVHNRLKGDGAPIDPFIRGIKFKNTKGE